MSPSRSFLVLYILSTCTFCCILSQQSSCPTNNQQVSAAHRLRKDVLCNYDKDTRPVIHIKNTTMIKMKMYPTFITVKERSNIMEVHATMYWNWKDVFLTWNPNDYDKIEYLPLDSETIWVPDIKLDSPGDMNSVDFRMNKVVCYISYVGEVHCFPPTVIAAYCNIDITNFPFDTHNCSMEFRSWAYGGADVNLGIRDNGVSLMFFKPDRDWELVNVNVTEYNYYPGSNNDSFLPIVKYNVIMKRFSTLHSAIVTAPAVVMSIMTVTTFWLGPTYSARVLLSALVIICNCMFLQYLGFMMVSNASKPIMIVTFYRDSLVLACFSSLVALVVRNIAVLTSPVPSWVSSLLTWLDVSYVSKILLVENVISKPVTMNDLATETTDDETALVAVSAATAANKNWKLLAVFIDRVCFCVFLTVFVSLLLCL